MTGNYVRAKGKAAAISRNGLIKPGDHLLSP